LAHNRLAKRAPKVLRLLDPFMEVAASGLAEVGPGVTLEVLLDDEDHRRRAKTTTPSCWTGSCSCTRSSSGPSRS
jgi:hypothetical protein